MIQEVIYRIFKERNFFLGIAILFVVCYHIPSNCIPPVFNILFYPGFIGVDFFLFFSAYGLVYSLGKRTIKDFYRRRFLRILPLFFILAVCKSLLYLTDGNSLTFFDWLCNLTTLSYYGVGGFIFDWYLCFLLLLYIAFPLLNSFVKNSNGGGDLFDLQWIVILFLFSFIGFEWQFETAIARLPIFTLGILCAKDKPVENYKHALMSFSIVFLISIFLLFIGVIHTYVIIYQLAPSLMFIICYLCFHVFQLSITSRIYKSICKIGSITLEVYVANNIALSMMTFAPVQIPRIVSYVFFNIILTIILLHVNTNITKRFSI